MRVRENGGGLGSRRRYFTTLPLTLALPLALPLTLSRVVGLVAAVVPQGEVGPEPPHAVGRYVPGKSIDEGGGRPVAECRGPGTYHAPRPRHSALQVKGCS